jgi:hypothetical protein
VWALHTSQKGLDLGIAQYSEERSSVLTARFGSSTDKMTLEPTDSAFHFLGGAMQLPSQIHKGVLEIGEDGAVSGMATVDGEINNFFSKMPRADRRFVVLIQSGIPVLVSSFYTAKGRRYTDVSLYHLRYEGAVVQEREQPISPRFVGFSFVDHLNLNDGLPDQFLDELFKRSGLPMPTP